VAAVPLLLAGALAAEAIAAAYLLRELRFALEDLWAAEAAGILLDQKLASVHLTQYYASLNLYNQHMYMSHGYYDACFNGDGISAIPTYMELENMLEQQIRLALEDLDLLTAGELLEML